MKDRIEGYYTCLFLAFAVAFVVLAVIGGINSYSPVPFWDMWNGYLGFFTQISHGDFSAWWAQHNEHRIVFSRILFWIDLRFFRGTIVFLNVMNYVLAGSILFTFFCILRRTLPQTQYNRLRFMVLSVVCIFSFSWIQENNLSWSFQSGFFAAQLFPLVAFYLLYLAKESPSHSNRYYGFACVMGIASAGTMANGVLALPLMAILAAVLRMSWRKVAGIVLLSGVVLYAYFRNYHTVSGDYSLWYVLENKPVHLLSYLLLYIGGPLYYMTGKGSKLVPQLGGVTLIASALFFAYKSFRAPKMYGLQLCLLVFILYIGGTAVGTGIGRLHFGLDQALSSRYMTPALMAWSSFLIIIVTEYKSWWFSNRRVPVGVLLLIPILLMHSQLGALKSHEAEHFEQEVAALALELGIHDQSQIDHIFPSADWALKIVKYPVRRDLSIFGNPLIKNIRLKIGSDAKRSMGPLGLGSLDQVSAIDGETRFVRVRGWLYDPRSKRVPRSLFLLDSQGKIVGYALTGQPRPDVAAAIGREAKLSGFKGYLLTKSSTEELTLQGSDPSCYLTVEAKSKLQR